MAERTSGIIIKQSDFGEGHRMLWIFTQKYGIIKAVAHGAEKTKSRSSASTQFLSYSEFEFYDNSEIWNIRSVVPSDTFWPIQEDIVKLALCTYFADLVFYSLDLHNADNNIFRLMLNTLYGCAYKSYPLKAIKLIFELKLMYFSGMLPAPNQCLGCGCDHGIAFFDKGSGGVFCEECGRGNLVKLTEEEYKVLFLGALCDMKKMFSYKLPEAAVDKLAPTIESYVSAALDRDIKSLEYYRKLTL